MSVKTRDEVFLSMLSSSNVDYAEISEDIRGIQKRVTTAVARVNEFFEKHEDTEAHEQCRRAIHEDPIGNLGLEEFIRPEQRHVIEAELRQLAGNPDDPLVNFWLSCTWCKAKNYAVFIAIGITFAVAVAVAAAILAGAGGPPAVIMAAIVGGLAAIAVYITLLTLAEFIVKAFGYDSLAGLICTWRGHCP